MGGILLWVPLKGESRPPLAPPPAKTTLYTQQALQTRMASGLTSLAGSSKWKFFQRLIKHPRPAIQGSDAKLDDELEQLMAELEPILSKQDKLFLAAFKMSPRASFEQTLTNVRREINPGLLYRLSQTPTREELKQLADFPGEVMVMQLRESGEWLLWLCVLGPWDERREKAREIPHYEDIINLKIAGLISVALHNHPYGAKPLPSLQDLLESRRNPARNLLITKEGLIEYETDHLTRFDGRMWPGSQPDVNDLEEDFQAVGLDIQDFAGLNDTEEALWHQAVYDRLHFGTRFISWPEFTSEILQPRHGPIPDQVRHPLPQVRQRALEILSQSDTAIHPIVLKVFGHRAAHDASGEVRQLCIQILESTARAGARSKNSSLASELLAHLPVSSTERLSSHTAEVVPLALEGQPQAILRTTRRIKTLIQQVQRPPAEVIFRALDDDLDNQKPRLPIALAVLRDLEIQSHLVSAGFTFSSGGPTSLEDVLRAGPRTRILFETWEPPLKANQEITHELLNRVGEILRTQPSPEAFDNYLKASDMASLIEHGRRDLAITFAKVQDPLNTMTYDEVHMWGKDMDVYQRIRSNYENLEVFWEKAGISAAKFRRLFPTDEAFWKSPQSLVEVYTLLRDPPNAHDTQLNMGIPISRSWMLPMLGGLSLGVLANVFLPFSVGAWLSIAFTFGFYALRQGDLLPSWRAVLGLGIFAAALLQGQSNDIGKNKALIEAQLKSVSPTQARAKTGQDKPAASFVSHQLLAFGSQDDRMNYLLQFVQFTPEGVPYFADGFEGHPASFLAEMIESGASLTRPWTVKGRRITLMQLIEGIHDRYGIATFAGSDPAWAITVLSQHYSLMQEWTSPRGEKMAVFRLITSGIQRMIAAGGRGIEQAGFTEQGIHFIDALSKVTKRYQGQPDPGGQLPLYRQFITSFNNQRIRGTLPIYSRDLTKVLNDYKQRPTPETALIARSYMNQLGHYLEAILNPNGILRESYSRQELTGYVQSLVSGITLWYSADFAQARTQMDAYSLEGVSLGRTMTNDILHAYRALSFWGTPQAALPLTPAAIEVAA